MTFHTFRLILLGCLFFVSKNVGSQTKLSVHTKALMGTKFTILLPESSGNDSLAEMAFAEIERLNNVFSTYENNSEVSNLNQTQKWVPSSQEMVELIQFSERLNKNSDGAFDIKIGQAIHVWKQAIESKQLPNRADIDIERKRNRQIRKCRQKLKTNKNTLLDFGGIAKGYAVDMAFLKLKKLGIDTVLIDGGGDIRMGEAPYGREGWKIMVSNDPGKMLILKNCAIATSGYEYQHLKIGDVFYSHIIDPRTFHSIRIKRGVSIIADDCKTADALATTFSVQPRLEKLKKKYKYKIQLKEGENFIIKEF